MTRRLLSISVAALTLAGCSTSPLVSCQLPSQLVSEDADGFVVLTAERFCRAIPDSQVLDTGS